jgi:hypothetical protein
VITAALIAAAIVLFAGTESSEQVRAWVAQHLGQIDRKKAAAVALLLAAAVYAYRPSSNEPSPPVPVPPDAFTLRFVGEHAAADASMLSALLSELADCIERDGTLSEPRLKTGVAFDDLRVAAREARMRGESLGARQPAVRDAIHTFLDDAVGTSGGPVTPESRAAWVSAYRDLSEAAAEAVR